MAPTSVGLLGATGETGTSILNGLIEAGGYDIIALVRPASLSKPANVALQDKGIGLRSLDLDGPQDAIVAALKDIEILISAIGPREQLQQVPLVTAAKAAGIKRFIPCAFTTIMPVGIHQSRDQKERIYNLVKQHSIPYTIIDVGWWYQIGFPALPSGKIDSVVGIPGLRIPGDGNQSSALTDLRDIGRYVARIIADERTMNRYVFAYNEMWSPHQVYDLLEKLSGESIPRVYVGLEELQARIKDADAKLADSPDDLTFIALSQQKVAAQYQISLGVRGDNTPEYAKYLGYLTSKDLYPDMSLRRFEDYLQEVLDGKAKGVYEELRARLAARKEESNLERR